jgi:hypothetical protein
VSVTAVATRPAPVALEEEESDPRFTRAVRWAWVALLVQFVAMVLWSSFLYGRWGNTWDFAIKYQGWWGIAHGNLDPYLTVVHRYLWQDHFELINWPLAPLSRVWPGSLWPLWVQDAMVVGGEAGAMLLVADAVKRPNWPTRLPGWTAVALVMVLLLANPWIYAAISFDVHFQSVGAACFAMLALREMIRGSSRLLVLWVVLCLACGDIAGTYLAAVGLGGVLAGREYRWRGALLLGFGVGWFLMVTAIGGGQGSSLASHYGYLASGSPAKVAATNSAGLLKGALAHPLAIVRHLWQARDDLWAYSVSGGGIGLFTPFSVLPVLVLVQSGAGQGPSLWSTAYENFGAVLFIGPLSVLALAWLTKQLANGWLARHLPWGGTGWLRSRKFPLVIAVCLAVNAIVWGAVWIPQIPSQWLTTSSAAAATLNQVENMIPPGAEVVASQGVMGRLSGRRWCYPIMGSGSLSIPIRTADDYFVITPYQGIETSNVQTQLGIIGRLGGPLHAQLLLARNGVWLFKYQRVSTTDNLDFAASPTEPAWATQTATGTPILSGPASDWAMTLTKPKPGYVLYGADWSVPPGNYQTTVTMASNVTAEVETWNSTTGTLLSRRTVPPTNGHVAIQSVVQVTQLASQHLFRGWGPFTFEPGNAFGQPARIEIRLWTKGIGEVSVYSVELQPVASDS